MIIWDIPLLLTTGLFLLILGPLYAWGLLHFFRYNFQWHLASIVGICFVISLTALSTWEIRGMDWEQYYWDLFVVFLAASPSMAYVGKVLHNDRLAIKRRVNQQAIKIGIYQDELKTLEIRLDSQARERREMVAEMRRLIDEKSSKSDFELFREALNIIGLRDEAKRILKNREN